MGPETGAVPYGGSARPSRLESVVKSVSKGSLPARILARAQALRRRTWGLVGAGLAAVVATVVLLTMWSSGPPDPRARQY
jgi:hypothetical protein